jgi:hypothetical protein
MARDVDNSSERLVRRWLAAGNVLPFRAPEPSHGPHVEIAGKKYALSDDSGPLGGWAEDLGGDEEGGPGTGHAKLIRVPQQGSKFKYLWVYDTDRQILAMWRVTDGNEKVYGPARSEMHRIVRLDRKKQLNRVEHDEFHKIEEAMRKAADENLRSLREWVERDKTTFQREVDERTQEFFDRHVVPLIDRAVSDIDKGASPLGFRPHSVDLPVRRQMISFVMSRIMQREFTPAKVEQYLKQHGLDPDAPGHDNQAAEWAVNDVQEKAFDKYLGR